MNIKQNKRIDAKSKYHSAGEARRVLGIHTYCNVGAKQRCKGESTDRLSLQDQNCWRPPSNGGYETPVTGAYVTGACAYVCGVLC